MEAPVEATDPWKLHHVVLLVIIVSNILLLFLSLGLEQSLLQSKPVSSPL